MSSDEPEDDTPARVARRMADAVTYLSSVADRAGLLQIADELRAVRRSLMKETERGSGNAEPADGPVSADQLPRRKASNESPR